MYTRKNVFLLAVLTVAFSLKGQMVETSKPAARSGKKAAVQTKATARSQEPSLADFGITARSLVHWKSIAGGSKLTLKDASLVRVSPGAKAPGFLGVTYPKALWAESGGSYPIYELQWRDYFAGGEAARPLAHLRMKGANKLQLTLDQGKSWTEGARGADGAWAFAASDALITLRNADERCAPTEFSALGIEHGSIVKFPRDTYGPGFTEAPLVASIALCVGYGRNECVGTLKCVGGDWVIPFRGAKCGDLWVGRSVEPRPFIGKLAIKPVPGWRTLGSGGDLQAKTLWVVISKNGVLVGLSRDPDIGHPDALVDSFQSAADFPLEGAKDLKSLAESFRAHQGKDLWLRSDEPDSLSWAADRAFVEAGLKVNLFPPVRNVSFCGTQEAAGNELWNRMSKRIHGLGGTVVAANIPTW